MKNNLLHWPPPKAWTSIVLVKGFRHFVAFNYSPRQKEALVYLVSVIDGDIRLQVSFEELSNKMLWLQGWHDFDDKDVVIEHSSKKTRKININTHLDPSRDSGLTMPIEIAEIRPWF
ncbi:TIGR02450 family Trp-rich protein [Prochlorococcus marinus]|uniref:TIGR02450 family Trp-rich protein n=1 Tax=Prochlorococcus marinus TaxID=1219 RepID=UPI0022B42CAC|nr:TIGR02450 family Trp-rich protein [Prochlorococcus marinus]